MNERIRQLAVQANWWKPLGLPSDWDEGDYVVSPEQMKKFAELIVRECAQFVSSATEVYTQAEQDAVVRAARGLKQYFGVEE